MAYNPSHFWDLSFFARQKRTILPKREDMCSKADATVTSTDHWWENQCSNLKVWSFEATMPPKKLLYWTRLPAISGALKVNRNWTRSLPKILVVYHLQKVFQENPVGKYIEHEFLGNLLGHSFILFFRKECSKWIFVFHFSKAIVDSLGHPEIHGGDTTDSDWH